GYWTPSEIGFTAPDDGWLVGPGAGYGGQPRVYHYDGEHWIDCNPADRDPHVGECGDPAALLPFTNTALNSAGIGAVHLAVAGSRVYLYGARATAGQNNSITGFAVSNETAAQTTYPPI